MKQILFYTTIILLAISNVSEAQQTATMNLELHHYLASNPNSTEQLHVLVQGNSDAVSNAIALEGGTIKFFTRDIASVNIEADKIFQLANQPGIIRIEGRHGTGVVLDDQIDINANVTPVKQGQSPLLQPYDGTGVVVGIIDDGIDITHPDFKDGSGNTRIKYLWSQIDATGGTTPSYGYGQEWDAAAIDAGASYTETSSYFGHGSIVAGIAAGNPPVLHQYEGVAPKSDLVVVAVDMGSNFLNNMVDATEYIYQKAQLLGKPCVINASVGTYGGSHDGLDLPALAINNLITAHNGQSFVAAAGNAGDKLLHLQYPVETDSAFSWFKYEPSITQVYYEVWAYKSQFDNVQFALGADMTTPYTYLGRTNYYNILADFNFSGGFAQVDDTLKTWGGAFIGTVTIQAETIDTTYHLGISIHTTNNAYLYRLSTKGSGKFDCWSNPAFTGTSNMVKPVNLPPVASYPDVARYRGPNQTQTIVSSFQCSDKIITVANFANRNTWTDVNGNTQTNTDTVGARGITSSIGPSRDGKIKPDISAPGNSSFGAGLLSLMPTFISNNPQKVGLGGQHILDGGTSMASPVVAGIVALYLQRYPAANWKTIKDSLLSTAVTDAFTTASVPNVKWGYGKVDAFRFMKSSDIILCGACPKPTNLSTTNITNHSVKLLWTTQPTSAGYRAYIRPVGSPNWLVKVIGMNNGFKVVNNLLPNTTYEWRVRSVCSEIPYCAGFVTATQTFTTALRTEDVTDEITDDDISISPNPASNEIQVAVPELENNFSINIYNILGQQVFNYTFNNSDVSDLKVNIENFASGTYQLVVSSNEKIFTKRFVRN
ncbi:MAG: S8 family serine peptidase [Bacteroidota bacterium]